MDDWTHSVIHTVGQKHHPSAFTNNLSQKFSNCTDRTLRELATKWLYKCKNLIYINIFASLCLKLDVRTETGLKTTTYSWNRKFYLILAYGGPWLCSQSHDMAKLIEQLKPLHDKLATSIDHINSNTALCVSCVILHWICLILMLQLLLNFISNNAMQIFEKIVV